VARVAVYVNFIPRCAGEYVGIDVHFYNRVTFHSVTERLVPRPEKDNGIKQGQKHGFQGLYLSGERNVYRLMQQADISEK
jgi:hypothetical protein